jgi:Ser/Thr protein kinase RdoA (MazF antagonist)
MHIMQPVTSSVVQATIRRVSGGHDPVVIAVPDYVTDLLAKWAIPADAEVSGADRGSNNGTFIVAQAGRRWVLRISQNLSVEQVRAEHRLLGRLRVAGLPFRVPEPVPARGCGTVVSSAAGPVTLCQWLPGVGPDLVREPELERFGQAIGLLGAAMRPVPPEDAPHHWSGDPLEVHPGVPVVGELCDELRVAGVTPSRVGLLTAAARRVATSWSEVADRLPRQVVHGDPAPSNVLVEESTGRVTGLLDFEIAGTAFRVEDLVVGLLQSGVLARPRWQRDASALVRGYLSAQRLDEAEVDAIPEMLLWRACGTVLWRAGRWRSGLPELDDVIGRLDALADTVSWLAANGEQLHRSIRRLLTAGS